MAKVLGSHKLTSTYHRAPYPAIDPSRPELSQAGNTVLVTGGSAGIGFFISQAFVRAGASLVIIVGRRANVLDDAVTKLTAQAAALGSHTKVISRVCDVADLGATEELWAGFQRDRIFVDVLLLNAGNVHPECTMMELGLAKIWDLQVLNVRSLIDFAERFYKQPGAVPGRKKFLVNVSSGTIFAWETAGRATPAYSLTKSGGTFAMQLIAMDVKPKEMQVVSFHPGVVVTDFTRRQGYDETTTFIDWCDGNLPGHFAVWAASSEAEFLHGRFAEAYWDVDEMRSGEVYERVKNDLGFLKIGVNGLSG